MDWRQYTVRIKLCGRMRWEKNWNYSPWWDGRVNDFDLIYVWDGVGEIDTPRGTVPLMTGVCLWLRPGWTYAIRQKPRAPLGVNYIHFDLLDAAGCPQTAIDGLPPDAIYPPAPVLVEVMTRHVIELLWFRDWTNVSPSPPPAMAALAQGPLGVIDPDLNSPVYQTATTMLTALLMELDAISRLAQVATTPALSSHYRQLISSVALELLEDSAAMPNIAELAERNGYSPDHFTRIFRCVTGKTPKEYLLDAKMSRACALLIQTPLPIQTIAISLGYDDHAYFSRQFTARIGVPPSQYRRQQSQHDGNITTPPTGS
jgi:AraC-like DNA-binding protein